MAGIAAAIVVLNLIGGQDPDRTTVGLGGQGPVVTSPTPSVLPSPTPVRTSAAPVSLSPTPAVVTPSATKAPAKVALFVLNSTGRQGLAARAAQQFKRKGWPITGTTNTSFNPASTTVYYLPGQEAAADLLMSEFSAVRRKAPRPANLEGRGMTVVVTGDYPA